MKLLEIGIRTRDESKKRLIEIAKGRPVQTLNQPKIWRVSKNAAIKYMRDNNIDFARLVIFNGGVSHFNFVDLTSMSESRQTLD